MSKFAKSAMTVNGNTVNMSMPFAKVDKKKRLVSGYATLNNLDTQDDIVLAEASAKAFSRARGNIREMHQPLAVGRMVDFREDEYFDQDSGETYQGIYVTAYVSEGAEDTWKKVLDGTLTGFSIGGEIKEASNEFVKEAGKAVRFIKDYDLVELSLVDNPANQLANIHSLQKSVFTIDKSATGDVTVKGMVADTVVENVFICQNDDTVRITKTEAEECPVCNAPMENAGWFEAGGDRAEKVRGVIAKFLNPAEKEAAPTSEGGVEMGFLNKSKDNAVPEGKPVEVVNPSEEFPDGEKVDEVAAEQEEEATDVDETSVVEEEEVEKAVTPEEVADDDTEISKKIDDLREAIRSTLEESKEETLSKVAELEKQVQALGSTFNETTSKFETKFSELGEKLNTTKSKQAQLEKAFNVLNSSTAIKKSSDLESEEPVVQKPTFWGDAFSPRR